MSEKQESMKTIRNAIVSHDSKQEREERGEDTSSKWRSRASQCSHCLSHKPHRLRNACCGKSLWGDRTAENFKIVPTLNTRNKESRHWNYEQEHKANKGEISKPVQSCPRKRRRLSQSRNVDSKSYPILPGTHQYWSAPRLKNEDPTFRIKQRKK